MRSNSKFKKLKAGRGSRGAIKDLTVENIKSIDKVKKFRFWLTPHYGVSVPFYFIFI